jgi:hypothetical protein
MGDARRKMQTGYEAPKEVDEQGKDDVYRYKQAGISERGGYVPFWLIVVVISLLVWSVYYTVRYWSGE